MFNLIMTLIIADFVIDFVHYMFTMIMTLLVALFVIDLVYMFISIRTYKNYAIKNHTF